MADQQELGAIDLNNLNLQGEEINIDPNADAYALPPPPPDGQHRSKLKVGAGGFERRKSDDGQKYISCTVQARIQADGERWDNQVVFDNFMSTRSSRFTPGTCPMATLLNYAGRPSRAKTDLELAKEFENWINGEPDWPIITQWRAYCPDCKKEFLKGMRKFPQGQNGQHQHVVECPNCGGEVSAQARIVRYARP